MSQRFHQRYEKGKNKTFNNNNYISFDLTIIIFMIKIIILLSVFPQVYYCLLSFFYFFILRFFVSQTINSPLSIIFRVFFLGAGVGVFSTISYARPSFLLFIAISIFCANVSFLLSYVIITIAIL
jgi:hypothetical protein